MLLVSRCTVFNARNDFQCEECNEKHHQLAFQFFSMTTWVGKPTVQTISACFHVFGSAPLSPSRLPNDSIVFP